MRDGLTHLELAEPREGVEELRGEVLYTDAFGNLVSNIGRDALARFEARFPAMRLCVRIGTSAPMEILQAYGDPAKVFLSLRLAVSSCWKLPCATAVPPCVLRRARAFW